MNRDLDVAELFERLGLTRPKNYFVAFGGWSDEPIYVEDDPETDDEAPRRQCTCCECFLHVGPPGCDGSDCRYCGRC
jgi:hypothetical protein